MISSADTQAGLYFTKITGPIYFKQSDKWDYCMYIVQYSNLQHKCVYCGVTRVNVVLLCSENAETPDITDCFAMSLKVRYTGIVM